MHHLRTALVFAATVGAVIVRLAHGGPAGPGGATMRPWESSAEQSSRLAPSQTSEPAEQQTLAAYGELPLSFEVNQGQVDPEVRFLSRGSGSTLFLTPTEMVLALRTPALMPANQDGDHEVVQGSAVRMRLVGANPNPVVTGGEALPGRVNYLLGNDPGRWRTDIPTYSNVRYQQVYPGVDLVGYGKQYQLEYDFVVAAGADPSAITLAFAGASRIDVDDTGDLVLQTAAGEVRHRKPVIYQDVDGARRAVSGGYRLIAGHQVGFVLSAYDAARPLA